MHEGVDLELRLVEGVLRRRDHVPVDDLTHARVQADLQSKKVKVGSENLKAHFS